MKRTKPNTRRTIAAALVAGRQAAPGAAETPSVDKPRGYHVSEHVLKYYKTTQI